MQVPAAIPEIFDAMPLNKRGEVVAG